MSNCLSVTVDIEDWYHIPSVCGSPFSTYKDVDDFFSKWKGRYDYLSGPTQTVLNILDEMDLTATFFVVADVVRRYPGLVESIAEKGHEIACHGLDHSCKIHPMTKAPVMSTEAFISRTILAKKMLEDACGTSVLGYRAPNAIAAGWMLDALESIGFKFDSSIAMNSFYNKAASSRLGVSTCPYYPVTGGLDAGEKRDIIEFPWAYWDVMGIKIPTAGGPMLRFLGESIILKGLKQSLQRGHTVLYFHPIDISNERFPSIGKGRPFYWAIKGHAVERRLRHILKSLKDVDKICLKDLVEIVP
jgi:peptidoglycan-N-acetylglucosamine deacetylase